MNDDNKLRQYRGTIRRDIDELEKKLDIIEEKLDKLNGSFAFAFYDKFKKKLICARDRFGLAPFYYTWKNNEFLFASELKALLATGKISNELNFESLNKYLSLLWVPGPDTILNDVKKLPAGHFISLDVDKEKFSINKWWDIKIKQTNFKSLKELYNK